MSPRAKIVGRRILLLAASVIVGLVLVESWFRLFHPVWYLQPLPPLTDQERLDLVHRRALIPRLEYELLPGFDRVVGGIRIRTNSLGLRDDELAPPGSGPILRIAAVGDSMTFGQGVAGEEAWPNALESRLDARPSARRHRYEVQNFGVAGYSSRDEALVVEHKVLPLRPDLVIIGYYLNDPETDPIQQLHIYFRTPRWWERSQLLRFLAQQRRVSSQKRLGGGDVLRYLHADPRTWESVPRAFADIHRAAERAGTRVLVVILPTLYGVESWDAYPYADLHRQVIAAARAEGLATFDVLPAYVASGRPPRELRYDVDHPNAQGHAIIAEAIAAEIVARHRELLGIEE